MKKILSVSVLISCFAFFVLPMTASGQVTDAPDECTLKYDFRGFDSACEKGAEVQIAEHGMCCLLNTLYNVTDWIFIALAAVAGIFVIIGAMTLLTSAGNSERTTSGRNYIMWAAIGLGVAFLAKAIPGIVKLMVGITG